MYPESVLAWSKTDLALDNKPGRFETLRRDLKRIFDQKRSNHRRKRLNLGAAWQLFEVIKLYPGDSAVAGILDHRFEITTGPAPFRANN